MKSTLVKIIGWIDRFNEFIGRVVAWLVPAMVIVIAIEVAARYFWNRPTIWVYDIAIFLFGYAAMLGGAHALKNHLHINVDIIYQGRSPRTRAIMDVISGLLIFFFLVLVIIYGWKSAELALAAGEKTNTEWAPPIGHFKLLLPISAAMMLLQGLANWIRSFYLALHNKELSS